MIGLVECGRAVGQSFLCCVGLEMVFRAVGIKDSTARYFIIHAMFNTVMVVTCFPDLMRVLKVVFVAHQLWVVTN